MKIGLDLSVIQTPHRMRGIGSTAINFFNNIPNTLKKEHMFVLFLYEQSQEAALSELNLEGMDYEIRLLQKQARVDLKLPGKLNRLNGICNSFRDIYNTRKGDVRNPDLSNLDWYLQFDQLQAVPRTSGVKTAVILYDLIPYVMESDYLWSYRTARMQGDSRKSSIRKSLLRKQYIQQIRSVCDRADKLIAISEHTKKDFVKFARIDRNKIHVVHLGIDLRHSSVVPAELEFNEYVENSWGFLPSKIDLKEKSFILFVGGVDPRRRLIDLVAAYSNLRAQGKDIRLVLAGDSMMGAEAIPVKNTKEYIVNSSYLDNIVFLGFVSDEQREWLYANAVAMVYPSLYEGFGLPILEAMQHGTPVITYKNSSIYEIAGDSVMYANDALSIKKSIEDLLTNPETKAHYQEIGKRQAGKFSWQTTSSKIINLFGRTI